MDNTQQQAQQLRLPWNLATRQLDAIMRVIFSKFPAYISRKQASHFHTQDASNNEQFEIGDTAFLVFKVCDRFTAGIPTQQLQFDCEFILGPALSLTQFPDLRPNDIQYFKTLFDFRTLTIAILKFVSFTRHLKFSCDFACRFGNCVG